MKHGNATHREGANDGAHVLVDAIAAILDAIAKLAVDIDDEPMRRALSFAHGNAEVAFRRACRLAGVSVQEAAQ